MNEFFQLAAKIAYDNKLSRYYGLEAKVAGDTWDKIKKNAGKAWDATKRTAANPHVQKGVASAAIGTAAGIAGKAKGMSGKGALGLGAGVAAGTEATLEGAPALFKKVKDHLARKRLAKIKPEVEGEYSAVPGTKKVKGSNIIVPQELSDVARGGMKNKPQYKMPETGEESKSGPRK